MNTLVFFIDKNRQVRTSARDEFFAAMELLELREAKRAQTSSAKTTTAVTCMNTREIVAGTRALRHRCGATRND